LGPAWAGTEVAVFSDLQVGMWWPNTAVVDRAVEADPDGVLLGGDFLHSTSPGAAAQVDTVLGLLSPLVDAGIPTLAVLGNHDHAVGAAEELTAALEDNGIEVQALDSVPEDAPRIVLMHNPTSFPDLPAGSAPLAVAGHTHCGQIAFPGTPDWSYLGLSEEEALVADGFAPAATGNRATRCS
jgi:predicted MPP superfamily phosphohydrolase